MDRAVAPERLRWLVGRLAVRAGDRLLELGCGRGHAVDLVCRDLAGGHILGLDRSSVAIAAARKRNARWLESGAASFVEGDVMVLAGMDLLPFDRIFAMNVNLFWTRSPVAELEVLGSLLAPGGTMHLGWESRSADRAEDIVARVSNALEAAGFGCAVVRSRANPGVVCVESTPPTGL